MTIKIEYQPDRHLLISIYTNPLDPYHDVQGVVDAVNAHYSPTGPMLYIISDVTELTINFSDLVVGLANATTRADRWHVGAPNSTTSIVGSGEMVALGASSVSQDQYGGAEVLMFATLDEAIAAVDEHRAKNA